jgi:hypothetical protein
MRRREMVRTYRIPDPQFTSPVRPYAAIAILEIKAEKTVPKTDAAKPSVDIDNEEGRNSTYNTSSRHPHTMSHTLQNAVSKRVLNEPFPKMRMGMLKWITSVRVISCPLKHAYHHNSDLFRQAAAPSTDSDQGFSRDLSR